MSIIVQQSNGMKMELFSRQWHRKPIWNMNTEDASVVDHRMTREVSSETAGTLPPDPWHHH